MFKSRFYKEEFHKNAYFAFKKTSLSPCKTSLSPCAIETYWNIHWLPFIVFLDQLVSFLHYSQEEHCLTNKFINDFANSLNF